MPSESILQKIKKKLPPYIADTLKDLESVRQFTNNYQSKWKMKLASKVVTKKVMKGLKKYIDQKYLEIYQRNKKISEMEHKLREKREREAAKSRKYPQSRVTSVPALRPVEPLTPTQKITIMPKPIQTITTKVPEPLSSGQVIKYPTYSSDIQRKERELQELIRKQPTYVYPVKQDYYIPQMIKTIRSPF